MKSRLLSGLAVAAAAAAAAAAAFCVLPQAALAADPADADWPCVQRKVPTLTPAAIWTGPQIGESADWRTDAEVAALVHAVRQRALPIADAEARIKSFAATLDKAERERRLPLVFAGLFETMNEERSEIMDGIERYARQQRRFADRVRAEASEMDALRRSTDADPAVVAEREEKLLWDTRIYDERRAALTYVCEVPALVEQRLFALGRVIAAELAGG